VWVLAVSFTAIRLGHRRGRRGDPDLRLQSAARAGHRGCDREEVNTAHARQRGPGERANAELKNWKILRKIGSNPSRTTTLIQTLITAA
jgi:hypothetical protein